MSENLLVLPEAQQFPFLLANRPRYCQLQGQGAQFHVETIAPHRPLALIGQGWAWDPVLANEM